MLSLVACPDVHDCPFDHLTSSMTNSNWIARHWLALINSGYTIHHFLILILVIHRYFSALPHWSYDKTFKTTGKVGAAIVAVVFCGAVAGCGKIHNKLFSTNFFVPPTSGYAQYEMMSILSFISCYHWVIGLLVPKLAAVVLVVANCAPFLQIYSQQIIRCFRSTWLNLVLWISLKTYFLPVFERRLLIGYNYISFILVILAITWNLHVVIVQLKKRM